MNNLHSEGFLARAVLALLLGAAGTTTAGDWQAKVDASLWAKVAGSTAPVDVIITPRVPSVAEIDIQALSQRTAPHDRPRVVHAALKAIADASQHETRAWLQREGIAYQSFIVANAISARVPAAKLAELAQRASTARIDPDAKVRQVHPKTEPYLFGKAINAIEPGVTYINADDVWALPGAPRGQGVVIGGQDTGYRWTHTALKAKYLGWDGMSADHTYTWHDAIHSGGGACGANVTQPCDDQGHGTHTMGTMVGDDGAANQIGVAPDAKWIGCRNMDQGAGTPTTYLECFEWFLAPYPIGGTPAQGDPLRAPHVMNNSWGCPTSEGCNSGNWATMQAAIANLTSAGVLVVVSAGNGGSVCSSVSDPPAMFDESFSIGAFSSSDGTIASFSSRGPVTVDGSGRMKPDVSAPGVSVRASTWTSDSSYGSKSGTSMAGPHVAGAAALLMSAVPTLKRQPALVRQYLTQLATAVSSTSCTSSGVPNNVYGSGRLDVLAAVQSALAGGPLLFDGFE